MTRDANKGITNMVYDPVLDVPLRVDFADGSRITYGYDGAGNRLSETVTKDGQSTTTDYLGGMQYRIGEPNPNKVATLLPGQRGPSRSLSVRKGDNVHMQVNARYETGPGKVQGLEEVATQVAGAASRTAAGFENGGLSEGVNGATLGSALSKGESQKVPAAYLNYLLYDTDYRLVDQGYVPVSEAAAVDAQHPEATPEALALDVEVQENGYLYTYLSNEASANGTPVFFDDFAVDHQGISIVQADDYYPFGARFAQSPERVLQNRYLYQGKELGQELGLGLYDFHARQYDPLLGRMTSVDPMAASFDGMSPYAGMGNNPVSYVDPDGQVIGLAGALIGGAVLGGGAGYLYGRSQGYTGRQMFASIAGGMVAGAGIAAGVQTGFFSSVGQSITGLNVPGVLDANIGYAERVFQGVKPFVDGGG